MGGGEGEGRRGGGLLQDVTRSLRTSPLRRSRGRDRGSDETGFSPELLGCKAGSKKLG